MRVEDRVKTNRRFNQGALNYKTVRPVTDKTNLLPLGGENLRSEYFERNIKVFYNGEFDPGSG